MVNIIWQDRETGVYVATHELYSRPAKLIGVVMPLAARKSQWTTDELKAVITKYETLPGCTLQKNEETPIITLCELEHLCPIPHTPSSSRTIELGLEREKTCLTLAFTYPYPLPFFFTEPPETTAEKIPDRCHVA
jgi:hypothetical protein